MKKDEVVMHPEQKLEVLFQFYSKLCDSLTLSRNNIGWFWDTVSFPNPDEEALDT